MRITVALGLLAIVLVTPKSDGFDFVRYDDADGAFSISLPSGYIATESDGGRVFNWTDEYMGRSFVSVSWTDDPNLTVDEVKTTYENLLGADSDLSAQKTIVPDTRLAAYGADDGLRGRYDVPGEIEDMRHRVTFLDRADRVYTFVIATPIALEEGILDVVNTIQNSVILQGGNGL
jgi:hypothetical protein